MLVANGVYRHAICRLLLRCARLSSCCQFFLSFFFFKQKTAYEMRISDWSSDVCSSDLPDLAFDGPAFAVSNEAPVPEHGWAIVGRHLNGLAGTILGGASEIQREVISKDLVK